MHFIDQILQHLRRRSPLYYAFLVLLFLSLLRRFSPLLGLLTSHPAHSVKTDDLLHQNATWRSLARESELIPRIIHQTWKNTTIPPHWAWTQSFTYNLTLLQRENWTYMFWTDASALTFIASHYPQYLDLYKGYKYGIQRADVLRYFLLHHYGGIYLDLDIAPYRRLDALLTLPAWVCETTPTGISNDALGSVKGHPFYQFVLDSLGGYQRGWGSPYVTVMASTGPLFLSLVLREYEKLRSKIGVFEPWSDGAEPTPLRVERRGGNADAELGRVIVLRREENITGYNFFLNVEGRSWQGRDEQVVAWFERHWEVTIFLALGAVIGVFEVGWRVGCMVGRKLRTLTKRVMRRVLRRGVERWNNAGFVNEGNVLEGGGRI
jgi:mannosyltransferase OCH1-like enzyme